jgi:hypothetical protein
MVQNPMDLFSNQSPKVEREEPPKPKVVGPPMPIDEENIPPLPENWREKVNEAIHFLAQIRDYGSRVPQMYNMTEEEFTRFMDDSQRFSKEDWELMSRAREDVQKFVSGMKDVLKEYRAPKKTKRKVPPTSKWISMD